MTLSLLLALALQPLAGDAPALADWPQFRGPDGQGHADAADPPLHWSDTENVAWRIDIPGRGWSSPVVVGDQVWMTTAVETEASPDEAKHRLEGVRLAATLDVAKHLSLRAVAVHRRTGDLLHNVPLFEIDDPAPVHQVNSFASPTPVIEPGRVYCHFGSYGTACVDTAAGRVVWTQRFAINHEVGPGSSPILYKDLLVLVCDGYDLQYVVALDKRTGQPVWKKDRPPIDRDNGTFKKAFCTPLVVHAAGRDQLVIPGSMWFVAYDPATGDELWRIKHGNGYSLVPRPVFGHDRVYLCTGFERPELWAVRLDGRGDVTDTHVAWKETRQIPKKPSPLLVRDELYVVSDVGVVTCLDANTGETHWQQRIGGSFSASPVFAAGRIYLFSEEGTTTVLSPGKTFHKLAENTVEGRIMASPAVLDDALLLRTDEHLYRLARPQSPSTTGG